MAQNKTNQFEADILKLIFNATTLANIAQNATSSPITSIFISLHTAATGEEITAPFASEANYTGYARVGVTRNGTEWVVTQSTAASGGASTSTATETVAHGAKVTNANAVTFAQCTAGTNTVTHIGICKSISGTTAADLLYSGPLTTSLTVSTGVTPQFAAGAIVLYEY